MTTRFEIPTGNQFGTVYADPPWPHDSKQNARRRLHYDRMTLDEICSVPVAEAVDPDGHLWLWATTTHLELAFQVIHAWGFDYKTTLVWDKSRLGIGWWIRNRHEFLLRAARSTKYRTNPGSYSSEIKGKANKHSEKPDETVLPMIEALSPGPFLELFSRREKAREGWTRLGADGVPTEAYNQPQRLLDKPDVADGVVRGVGGLEIVPDMEYHYLKKEIIYIPVKAISQKGRRVTVQFADGVKKSVSIDKLRPVDKLT
jgi:N6-adenosine-specific RNA methylase IME4